MTPIEYISASMHVGLALLLLWVLLFHFWRNHRTATLRERLFALRGELFDYAASGEVSFDDPAYAKLRMVMNGMIRFAHNFTFTRIAMLFLFRDMFEKLETTNPLTQWQKAVATLPAAKQKKLRELHDKMIVAIVWHVTCASPILLPIFFLVRAPLSHFWKS